MDVGARAWVSSRLKGLARQAVATASAGARNRSAEAEDLVARLDDSECATPQEWASLRSEAERLLARRSEALAAGTRIKIWLAAHDRRGDLDDVVAARWFDTDPWPTEVVDGRVLAVLPDGVDVPPEIRELTDAETALRAVLREVRVVDGRWQLTLFVRIDGVDQPAPGRVQVWLEDGLGGRIDAEVSTFRDQRANQADAHGTRHQDHSGGGVLARIDPALLAGSDRWVPMVAVEVAGVRRHGGLTRVDTRGSAGMIGTGQLPPVRVEEVQVGLVARPEVAFVTSPAPRTRVLDLRVLDRTVTGRVADAPDATAVVLRGPGSREVAADLATDGTFSLAVPVGLEPRERWSLQVRTGADLRPVAWPGGDDLWWAPDEVASPAELLPIRDASGGTDLVEATGLAALSGREVGADGIVLHGHWLGPVPAAATLVLRGPDELVVPADLSTSGSRWEAHVDTRHDPWRTGQVAHLPVGRYWLELTAEGRSGAVWLTAPAVESLLDAETGPTYHHRLVRKGRDAGLFLQAPLREDERGPFNQRRMQQAARATRADVEADLVYLQSFQGTSATDSPLALHHEIRASRPDLRIVWGVRNHASWTPDGAERVVMDSERWYEVLSTARYLAFNVDLERWYSPRPEQRLLQTFHGYPGKKLGVGEWESKGLSPRRIEHELGRTGAAWSLMLSPTPEMDHHFRTNYRYTGEIHNLGYPRDDMLVGPEAAELRARTRAQLGIEDHQTVVLYGPTWRDDRKTGWRAAESVDTFDLAEAHAALPDHVFLMRGHRFTQPQVDVPGVIDVTGHPEINHLILAADAAVLDYSSLRFDFALTGRPMVFVVPDLADYAGRVRGFIYDFTETAPGPLVTTTAAAIEQLRDLPGLTARHGDEYAAFNQRFNAHMDGHAAARVAAAWLV